MNPDSEHLARLCATLALEKKAEAPVVLDLRGISTFTDFFVICSGQSEPQLKAISEAITDGLKPDIRPLAVDGYPLSQWVVIDFGSVVVHIFHQGKRELYSLEDLWNDAPRIQV